MLPSVYDTGLDYTISILDLTKMRLKHYLELHN